MQVRENPMLTLPERASRCAAETERFFQGKSYDPGDCFELFRLAILERDSQAWEAVYVQYQVLVGRWVQQHPAFERGGEEAQFFVNRAFEKIWVALTPDKFRNFTELKALLGYLKMCVHSVITDHARAHKLAELMDLAEETGSEPVEQGPSLEERVLERADRQKFWEALYTRLHNEKERQVVYGSFFLALKPSEIYDQFHGLFFSVEEVYLVKQNVLARLRRDEEMLALFEHH
jgi:DNA-directed RNA polymerase specialized sigma24 family protein